MKRWSNLERRLLGTIAARARWGKTKLSAHDEAVWREGWLAGVAYASGWPRDRKPNRIFMKPANEDGL